MKIEKVSVYEIRLPVPGGAYRLSRGRRYTAFDDIVVMLETDAGVVGWGEVCTLGANYLPAFSKGVRAALDELAPCLLGENPTQVERVNHILDQALLGHPYTKSALDVACWDLLGKATGLPICDLLGGRFGDAIDLLSAVPTDTPGAMAELAATYRARNYRYQSIKLGGDPNEDVARIRVVMEEAVLGEEFHADCNRGWTGDQALRVMRRVRDLDLYFEQPCATYEECLALRRRTDQPIILDEIIDGPETMLRVAKDAAADMINLKISRVGGLTKARRVRDICLTAGLPLTLQDTGGGALTQAAIVHLAQSTPAHLRRCLYNPIDYASHPITEGALQPVDGRLSAPHAPGLGVAPPMGSLGNPVAVYAR